MAARGAEAMSIKGLTDKRNIIVTFVVTLAGEFLPLQIIMVARLRQAFYVVSSFLMVSV